MPISPKLAPEVAQANMAEIRAALFGSGGNYRGESVPVLF